MSEQLSVFDVAGKRIGKFHAAAHDTELAAAVAMYPKSGTNRYKVLKELGRVYPDGMTDWELHFATGQSRTGVVARRNELVSAGLVEKTDGRRPGPDGVTMGIVWRLTDQARNVFPEVQL